jgi:hypothetical protein
MNWLRNALRNFLRNDNITANKISPSYEDVSDLTKNKFWHIQIFPAIGGKIVEIHYRDDTKDFNRICSRYIISDDKNFSESLSKIVSMEFLKN